MQQPNSNDKRQDALIALLRARSATALVAQTTGTVTAANTPYTALPTDTIVNFRADTGNDPLNVPLGLIMPASPHVGQQLTAVFLTSQLGSPPPTTRVLSGSIEDINNPGLLLGPNTDTSLITPGQRATWQWDGTTWLLQPGSGVPPVIFDGSFAGPFTNIDYFSVASGVGGPQMGDDHALIALVHVDTIDPADHVFWSNMELGTGWALVVNNNLFLVSYRPAGAIFSGVTLRIGLHILMVSQSAGVQINCVDGFVNSGVAPAYLPTGAGALHRIGNNVTATIAGCGVLQLAALNRAMSAAEMQAIGAQSQPNRYRLPPSLTSDPALSFLWTAFDNYTRQGQATTSSSTAAPGNAPTVLTTVGQPLIAPLREQLTNALALPHQNSRTSIPVGPNGSVILRDSDAELVFMTDDTQIALDQFGSNHSSPQVGDLVNGTFDNSTFSVVVAPVGADLVTATNLQLAVGLNKQIILREGLQTAPTATTPNPRSNVEGTLVRSIRTSPGQCRPAPTTRATERLVIVGDSIPAGGNTTLPVQLSWPMLLRDSVRASGKGVTVISIGFYGLASWTTADLVNLTVASLEEVAPGGRQLVWFELQTNDYGLLLQTHAAFGVQLGQYLDGVHAAIPGVEFFLQTAISRIAPASEADIGGGALPTYRAEDVAVAVARAFWLHPPVVVVGPTFAGLAPVNYDVDGIHPLNSGHNLIFVAVPPIISW